MNFLMDKISALSDSAIKEVLEIMATDRGISVTKGYTENLIGPQKFRSRTFKHEVTKILPAGITKEEYLVECKKMQQQCERIVQKEIQRTIETEEASSQNGDDGE